MMKITGIHHASIKVVDMERAARFYKEVLGLREIRIPSTFPPAGINVRWFAMGDEQLHLMPADKADELSARHFALHIEDLRAAREHLVRHGLEPRETTQIPGADRCFINDPDGNLIELIEWKTQYETVIIEV